MIRYISLLTFVLLTASATCGYSQSKLVFTGTYQGNYHQFDSMLIGNVNTGSAIVKYYPDTILTLLITGINELPDEGKYDLGQNYPNPYEHNTRFNIYMPQDDRLCIKIFNASGNSVLNYEEYLPSGSHSFTFTGNGEKMYILSAKASAWSSAIKMLNGSSLRNSDAKLEYNGNFSPVKSTKKGKGGFEYNTGDNLIFIGYMTDGTGSVITDTITDSPVESTTYTFRFGNQNRIVILMYHKITDSEPSNVYERNSSDFENDLIYLQDHNYQILSMEDLLLLRSGELELLSDGIIITFDDGY